MLLPAPDDRRAREQLGRFWYCDKLIPRMNVKAIYVQVVPDRTWKDPAQHGLGASDNDQRQSDQVFWYIEKVEQILPSFWFERRSS